MTDPYSRQRAANAYRSAAEHSVTSSQLWLMSLDTIAQKLQEAADLREAKDFKGAFARHERIYQILAVLQSGLPEEQDTTDPVLKEATENTRRFYKQVADRLSIVAASPDPMERYRSLRMDVTAMRENLAQYLTSDTEASATQPSLTSES